MSGEPGLAFERPGVATRTVVLFAGGFLAFAALTGAALTFYYRARVALSPKPSHATFPAPRLQVEERDELDRLLKGARLRLDSSNWIDRAAGLVHLPIEDSMRRVVARGAAGFDPIAGAPVTPSPARDAPDRAAMPDRPPDPAPSPDRATASGRGPGAPPR